MAEDKVTVYMRLYVGDYIAGTRGMNLEQRGAYVDLLCHMWNQGGAVPLDHEMLRRLVGADSQKQWERVWAAIKHKFVIDEATQTFTNPRLQEERTKAQALRTTAIENGKRGGRPQKRPDPEPRANPPVNPPVSGTEARAGSVPLNPRESLSAASSQQPEALTGSGARGGVWDGNSWYRRFGAAWCAKYGQLSYGQGSADAKGTAAMGALVGSLSPAECLDAQARAAAIFAEYLGNESPQLVAERHPWVFFVARFNGLRVPKAPAKGSAPAKPAGPVLCEFHRDYRNGEKRARRHDPNCSECKHVAALNRPRGDDWDPEPIGGMLP